MSMTTQDWAALSEVLSDALSLTVPPIAITFSAAPVDDVPQFQDAMPSPTPDGRTGRVPAGCVFWMKAVDATFNTLPEDHFNCSVGSYTHGLKNLQEVADNKDIAALMESGWVDEKAVMGIPFVTTKPGSITYGPLAQTPVDPDVILLRLAPRSLMILHDAYPDLPIGGKPQCHIVAIAKEHHDLAASVGCMLSRVRTGMPNTDMTCAIPASRMAEVVERAVATAKVDGTVGRYAAEDSRRFR
jgi:uncharacterized protein (DUF169 family)